MVINLEQRSRSRSTDRRSPLRALEIHQIDESEATEDADTEEFVGTSFQSPTQALDLGVPTLSDI